MKKAPDVPGLGWDLRVTGSPVTNRRVVDTPPSPRRAFFGQPASSHISPDSAPTICPSDFGLLSGGGSMRGEIINEYQKLNLEDRKAFRAWLWVNAVVGAIC